MYKTCNLFATVCQWVSDPLVEKPSIVSLFHPQLKPHLYLVAWVCCGLNSRSTSSQHVTSVSIAKQKYKSSFYSLATVYMYTVVLLLSLGVKKWACYKRNDLNSKQTICQATVYTHIELIQQRAGQFKDLLRLQCFPDVYFSRIRGGFGRSNSPATR